MFFVLQITCIYIVGIWLRVFLSLHFKHCHWYRKGAQFAESWQDGSAFAELLRKQEEVTSQREELEKERKFLMKRKPGATGGKSVRHNVPHDLDITGSARSPQAPLTHEEYQEREEVLKLRAGALKKVNIVNQGKDCYQKFLISGYISKNTQSNPPIDRCHPLGN